MSHEHVPHRDEPTPPRLHAEEVGSAAPVVAPPGERRTTHAAAVAVAIPSVQGTVPSAEPSPPGASGRGWLVPVGGRMEDAAIIERFVALCGGAAGSLVVVPTASSLADAGTWYRDLFCRHGAGDVHVLRLQRRGDVLGPDQLDLVRHATGVFFTGGNQLKLATSIIGTPLAALLHARFAHGMPVGGTSAGAAFLSAHMIAFGQEGALPHAGMVITCGGLGLTGRYLIDQHFRERGRLGRLLTAVAYNPFVCGLGVDENTAVFIGPDDTLEVVGEGAATLVDPSALDTSHILEALPGAPLQLPGMKVRVIEAGAGVGATARG